MERPAWLQVWAQAVDPNNSVARTRIAESFMLFSVVVPTQRRQPAKYGAMPAVVEAMDETKDWISPPHSFE
jgi:hypothetical protein